MKRPSPFEMWLKRSVKATFHFCFAIIPALNTLFNLFHINLPFVRSKLFDFLKILKTVHLMNNISKLLLSMPNMLAYFQTSLRKIKTKIIKTVTTIAITKVWDFLEIFSPFPQSRQSDDEFQKTEGLWFRVYSQAWSSQSSQFRTDRYFVIGCSWHSWSLFATQPIWFVHGSATINN